MKTTASNIPTDTLQILWGGERHKLIAGAADQLLTDAARDAVAAIAGENMGLIDVAIWADTVKRREPTSTDDDDTVSFLKDERNAKNDTWHYVDIPAAASTYDRDLYPQFTRDDDVVQTLIESIRVLQKKSDRFTPLNALRLLVHLVGDVHQPLHVGCSYIDKTGTQPKLELDPKIAADKKLRGDKGGNALTLRLEAKKTTSLHSYWDSTLGGSPSTDDLTVEGAAVSEMTDVAGKSERDSIDALYRMVSEAQPEIVAVAVETDPEEWPVAWATESLHAAKSAFATLSIESAIEGKSAYLLKWNKAAYDKRCGPIVLERMQSAVRNLAKLVNAVLV